MYLNWFGNDLQTSKAWRGLTCRETKTSLLGVGALIAC